MHVWHSDSKQNVYSKEQNRLWKVVNLVSVIFKSILVRNSVEISTKTLCTVIFRLKDPSLETLQLINKTKTWKVITIILQKSCVALVFSIVRPPSKFDFCNNFVQESSTDKQNFKSWPCIGLNLVGCSVSLQKRKLF